MNAVTRMRSSGMRAGMVLVAALGAGAAGAYTPPYSTPPGITLVDTDSPAVEAAPMLLWRRLGDANGNPLYTYDADPYGRSSCYAECAREFPPFVADAHARGSGDFSIIVRDDHLRQWAYQGKPLYRYSGKDPVGEPPLLNRGEAGKDPAQFDPASRIYSPKRGWRRAAYMPEKSIQMPADVELDALAVANGFGFVDAVTRQTIYAAPASHKLPADWQPVVAAALATPVGAFSIITRKEDGTRQWTYRGEALYTYSGDYASGEVTGLFAGDRSVHAALAYQNFLPAGIEIGHYLGRGPLMTTTQGLTLYYVSRYHELFGGRETRTGYAITYNDAKSQGTAGCEGDCTRTWKPVLAAAKASGSGFWEVIVRPDGSRQWAFKGSPVYTYIGDRKGGDVAGNNRHVILYGGPQGQIVYADAGGDPKNPGLVVGRNITMLFATGAHPKSNTAAAPGAGAEATRGPAAGTAGARGNGGRSADADAAAANGVVDFAAVARSTAALGTPGAGFYWHTVGLFY
jgi:predicted lipoprotein with Yx(FWY)xxD motif